MDFITFLFDTYLKPKPPEPVVPDWLIPDNWDEGKTPGKYAYSDLIDVSPNIIKGVFSSEHEEVIRWVVSTLINTGHPWRVTTEVLEPPSESALFLIHVPNVHEKPAFFKALKFYLEQIYVS